MCGIVGLIGRRARESGVDLMLSMITHRGPDELGTYAADGVAIGNARLSIIDLAHGQQPMLDDETGVVVAFNGEIFNYVELGTQLSKGGTHFSTKSDTEVLLRLYLEHGEEAFERLNGQFAIAIWDPRQRKLILARDRFGICPLFYAHAQEGEPLFLFASEIKALLTHPRVKKRLDVKTMDQTFTFWCPVAGRTIIEAVRELPPGCKLVLKAGGTPHLSRYWDWPFPQLQEKTRADFPTALKMFDEALAKAVGLRLRADIDVGSYLSGGIDSSAIVAVAAKLHGPNLRCFSIGFKDASYDESPHQHKVADAVGVKHTHVECGFDDIDRHFEAVMWHAETPLFRTAPAPMRLLSETVQAQGMKVILTGEGSDEILLGYDLFREVKLRRFWGRQPGSQARPQLFKKLYAYLPQFANPRYAALAIQSFKPTLSSDSPFYSHLFRWSNNAANKAYFSPQLKAELSGYDAVEELRGSLPADFFRVGDVDRAQYLELVTLLRGYLLSSQGDRMIMANSVEGRFPFLDHEFAAFASSLPERYKLCGLKDKRILRKSMAGKLPEDICGRPKFAYQSPEVRAFYRVDKTRSPLIEKYLSPKAVRETGLFDPALVAQLLSKIEASDLARLGTRDNMAFVQILSSHIIFQNLLAQDLREMAKEKARSLTFKTRLRQPYKEESYEPA